MLLSVMGVGFDSTYKFSGKWNTSRFISRLYGWVHKTLRLSLSVVNIVLWLWEQDGILWVANFRFPFYKICVQNRWGHKVLRPWWGLWYWRSQFNYCQDGRLTRFSILILWTLCKKFDEGKSESIALLIFVLWRCMNCRWMRGGGVGQKVLITCCID